MPLKLILVRVGIRELFSRGWFCRSYSSGQQDEVGLGRGQVQFVHNIAFTVRKKMLSGGGIEPINFGVKKRFGCF